MVKDRRRANRPLFYRALWRYPCNWVGGLRLLLLAAALVVHWGEWGQYWRWSFVGLMGSAALLDLLDGYLARRLGHLSRFGTTFDFLTDQISHTVLWLASGSPVAVPLMLLEWCTLVVALRRALVGDEHWKETLLARGGRLVRVYFGRNQRNVLAGLGVVSHFALPAALYLGLPAWAVWPWAPGVLLYAWVTLLMLGALRKG
ncbi:MAG: hypothetical protein GKR89_24850 [Candidatus Latescibacteria bacterium]|nr:hypothetical protein [Candidatus Latescibacterota bacterium]